MEMQQQKKIEKKIEELKKQIANILDNFKFNDWLKANKNSPRMKLGTYTESGRKRKWRSFQLSDKTTSVHSLYKNLNRDKIDLLTLAKSESLVKEIRRIKPIYLEPRKENRNIKGQLINKQ